MGRVRVTNEKPPSGEGGLPSLNPFNERKDFGRLWASVGAANLGDGLMRSLGPLLAASLTRDPVLVAGISVAQYLPWLLFTLASGVAVDRIDRRRLLVIGNTSRMVVLVAFTACVLLGEAPLWLLYAAVFVVGLAETVVDNASIAVLPAIVARERLDWANGRLYATLTVTNQLAGPALAGVLFTVSTTLAVATGSATYLVAAIGALLITKQSPNLSHEAGGPSALADMRAGVRYFWSDRLMRDLAVQAAAFNFAGAAVTAISVLAITGPMGLSPLGFGLFLAFTSLGGIGAGITAQRLVSRVGRGTILLIGALAPAAAYCVVAATFDPVASAIAMLAAAATTTYGQVVTVTQRQATVPDHLLGRVISAFRFIGLGVIPIGALCGGALADRFGLGTAFLLGALVHLGNAVFIRLRLTNARLALPPHSSGNHD